MEEIVGNPKYKRVYIAGPINGMPNDNIEEFEKYEEKFKNLNFEVVNPHKLHSAEKTNELKRKLELREISFEEFHASFMRTDIKHMMDCDFIAVLKGWEKSKGANIEFRTARDLNMPVICAITLTKVF